MAKILGLREWKTTHKVDPSHIRVAPAPRAYLFRLLDGSTAFVLTPGDHLRAVQLLRHMVGAKAWQRPHDTWQLLDEEGTRAALRRRRRFSWFGEEGVWLVESGRVESR